MLLIAGGGAVMMTAFWYVIFFRNGINAGKEDETVLTNGVIPLIGLFHGFFAGGAAMATWKKRQIIQECVANGEEDRFRRCLTNRIPGTIHLLLAVLSFSLISALMLVKYYNPWIGAFAVQSIGFILLLYWQVATNLDNPFRGIWYVGQITIPPGWLKEKPHGDETPRP
jgi:hypothetical protein